MNLAGNIPTNRNWGRQKAVDHLRGLSSMNRLVFMHVRCRQLSGKIECQLWHRLQQRVWPLARKRCSAIMLRLLIFTIRAIAILPVQVVQPDNWNLTSTQAIIYLLLAAND
jgi:hypothetical protein